MPKPHRLGKGSSRPVAPTAQETEIAALLAEVNWLKANYETRLEQAFAEIARLKADAADPVILPDGDLEVEVASLRSEVRRMSEGERRYLDRIEELKQQITKLKISVNKLKSQTPAKG